jgi:hypothetical protein
MKPIRLSAIVLSGLVIVSLAAGATFSRCYWGYWLSPPALRHAVGELAGLSSFVQVSASQSAPDLGWLISVPSAAKIRRSAASHRRSPVDNPWGRLQAAVEDAKLQSVPLGPAPEGLLRLLEQEIGNSELLVAGEPDYPFAKRLSGFAAIGPARTGGTLVVLALSGLEKSNDHYPLYNFAYVCNENRCRLTEQRRYFEDVAGIEGFRWYASSLAVFFLGLVLLAILSTFTVSAGLLLRQRRARLHADDGAEDRGCLKNRLALPAGYRLRRDGQVGCQAMRAATWMSG